MSVTIPVSIRRIKTGYITVKQIAKVAGVSVNTVSRALNGKPDINEDTRQRVLEVAKRLGYVPNRSALSLKCQKTLIVGVIVEDNANPFWAEILKGVESAAKERGYHVILVNTNRNYQEEVEGIRMLLERRVDGLLIAPNQEGYDDLYELKRLRIPFVVMGRHVKEFEGFAPMVYSDEVQGGYNATMHLIEKGCENIAFIGAQPYNTASIERCEGYIRALKEAEMKIDPSLIKTGGIEIDGGYESTIDLIKSGVNFDGVFVYNDLMAFGVLKALKKSNLRVPEDVKVIGYDDISYSSLITPSLTTMKMKKGTIGRLSFELLLNPENKIVLEAELIVRDSTNG